MNYQLYYIGRNLLIFFCGLAFLISGCPGKQNIKKIAHTGLCTQHLENTEAAFKGAIENGSDGIETDVRFTKDGIPVTWHDSDIKYTDGTSLVVSDATYAELSSKPIVNPINGEEAYLCTLERYFEICRESSMICFLDLKGDWSYDNVKTVMEMGARIYNLDMIIPQSSDVENIKKVRELYPDQRIMLTYGRLQFEKGLDYTVCFEYGFDIDCDYTVANKKMIKEFRDKGLQFGVFTCNTKLSQAYACYLGIDYMESDV